jgi:hypothetical protein
VTVKWFDRSDNENGFEVFRRDANGAWQSVYRVPTRNVLGGDSDGTQDYTWVDTSTSLSGQCYRIAAYNDTNVGYSDEECTVRPDPNRFPQAVSTPARQWGGLSSTNDGTGNLINFKKNSHLKLGSQTFGVDLNWGDTSLWRVEAQGGPRLMEGQAVALKVWGGGWLKHGHQNFGVDLQLSDTPVYEWYAIGGGGDEDEFTFAGRDLTSAVTFALWNSSANAYLVNGHQTWGIDLNWYTPGGGGTPPPPPPPPTGVKHINILNCVGSPNFDPDPPRTISIWARDATAGAAFTRQGDAPTGWGGSSCTGQSFTFTPSAAGHVYQVLAVDYNGSGCTAGDAPNMGCNVLDPFTFTADPTRGVDLPITIS